ncbi:MAG: ankyrin repeat domain-containing protein [Synergistaceae bacterium]|nr:ankyrin repeat domain-containing protein [Synergistaceae bacterium]
MSKEERNIGELKTMYYRLAFTLCGKGILNGRNDKKAAKLIREAVEAGFPVNYIDKDGWTLLHQAAGHNRPECCRALIELGADPNLKDNCGWTPFLNACWRVNIDCAKLLIDAGARWDIPSNDGKLPLKDLGFRGWTTEKAELEAYIARHLNLQKRKS